MGYREYHITEPLVTDMSFKDDEWLWCHTKGQGQGWRTLCSQEYFAPFHTLQTHTLLLRIFCYSAHFATQHILIPGTLCFLKHFAPQHILLTGTLCSLEHFAPWNNLVLCKMFSTTYFALWNINKVRWEAKCTKPLWSKVFQGAKWSGKQNVCQPGQGAWPF
jgi:hypothetical protein